MKRRRYSSPNTSSRTTLNSDQKSPQKHLRSHQFQQNTTKASSHDHAMSMTDFQSCEPSMHGSKQNKFVDIDKICSEIIEFLDIVEANNYKIYSNEENEGSHNSHDSRPSLFSFKEQSVRENNEIHCRYQKSGGCFTMYSLRNRHIRKKMKTSRGAKASAQHIKHTNKLIGLYRRLLNRWKVLESECKTKQNLDARIENVNYEPRLSFHDIQKLSSYLNILNELLRRKIFHSSAEKNNYCAASINVDDMTVTVDKTSRDRSKYDSCSNTHYSNPLNNKTTSMKPAGITVNYDKHVKHGLDVSVCKRIFNERPSPVTNYQNFKPEESNDSTDFQNTKTCQIAKNQENSSAFDSVSDNKATLSRESPVIELIEKYFLSSDSQACLDGIFSNTYKITVRTERISGGILEKYQYITLVSWTNSGKIYVGL